MMRLMDCYLVQLRPFLKWEKNGTESNECEQTMGLNYKRSFLSVDDRTSDGGN